MTIEFELEQELTKKRAAINMQIIDGLLNDTQKFAQEMLEFAKFCKEKNLTSVISTEIFDFSEHVAGRTGIDSKSYRDAYKAAAS